jgi:hypothetical protein
MNYHKLLGLCLSVIFVCANSFAQNPRGIPYKQPGITPKETDYNKPKLFTSLPDQILLDKKILSDLFLAETGKEITLGFEDKTIPEFAGKLISVASKYENKLQSIVVRSSNFNGATLTLSSTTMADGTINYTGRIISFQHGDAFELQKKNDEYYFVKKNLYELVNE